MQSVTPILSPDDASLFPTSDQNLLQSSNTHMRINTSPYNSLHQLQTFGQHLSHPVITPMQVMDTSLPSDVNIHPNPFDKSSSPPGISTSNPNEQTPISSSADDSELSTCVPNRHSMVTRSKHGISKPKKILSLQAKSTTEVEPTTYREAVMHEKWR